MSATTSPRQAPLRRREAPPRRAPATGAGARLRTATTPASGPPSVRFAAAARALGVGARQRGLRVPAFRSPPRLPEVSRTLRRRADGSATVAVVVRGRPFGAVVADMVEGIVVANALTGAEATRTRTALWEAVTRTEQHAA